MQTTLQLPSVRDLDYGIGQSERGKCAIRASGAAKAAIRLMLEKQVEERVSSMPGVLPHSMLLIVSSLQWAVKRSIAPRIVGGRRKTLQQHHLDDLVARKRSALEALIPEFHSPEILSIDTAVQAVTDYATELITEGLLGFDLSASGKIGYSYVLHEMEITPLRRNVRDAYRTEQEAPYFSKVIRAQVHTASGKTTHRTAEHVHYLGQDVQTVPFLRRKKEKPGIRLPIRVHQLTRDFPIWLKQHLLLTTGTIVREEVHVKDEFQTTWESVISTERTASPAIKLGGIVLAGWSSADFTEEAHLKKSF